MLVAKKVSKSSSQPLHPSRLVHIPTYMRNVERVVMPCDMTVFAYGLELKFIRYDLFDKLSLAATGITLPLAYENIVRSKQDLLGICWPESRSRQVLS